MESHAYYTITGILVIIMALSPGLLKKLPVTSSIIYLLFGLLIGPNGFGLVTLDVDKDSKLIEVIAEVTVIISLFTVGLKLRLPLRDLRWVSPLSLASLAMVIMIAMVASGAYFLLGFSLGSAILLGAVLAPTDPVLASELQMKHPSDDNNVKFALTAEGGMNDGTAFPFVMLGIGTLGLLENWSLTSWILIDLIWAIICGIAVGCISGVITSKLANYVKEIRNSYYLEDFLTIGSIALSYGLAIELKGYGFLSVFACALTIRQIEFRKGGLIRRFFKKQLPEDVLSFNEQLERIFEVVSVVSVGLLINLKSFQWKYIIAALILFLVIRPLAVFLGNLKSQMNFKDRLIISWFGIKGIGSIYYFFYAVNHGYTLEDMQASLEIVLWIIFISIIVHGATAKMKFFHPAR